MHGKGFLNTDFSMSIRIFRVSLAFTGTARYPNCAVGAVVRVQKTPFMEIPKN